MKKTLFILAIVAFGFASCDKVENPYPVSIQGDYSLYPDGDSAHYAQNVWPTFTTNTNTDRNVLIEDFTGHQCIFCPAAADAAHQLELANPGRVFISTIHTGASGQMEAFQEVTLPTFAIDFTNPEGFAIGKYFGFDWPGSPFVGNPYGTVNRADHGNGFPTLSAGSWASSTDATIAANDNKVNIQAVSNYYPSTRGFFLHTEVDVVDASLTNQLNIVVHLLEDTLVAPQKYPSYTDYSYVHRDIFRGSIDGFAFGQELNASNITTNGTYENFYIYELPAGYDPTNMHVIIYVRDDATEEIYQVIKKHL